MAEENGSSENRRRHWAGIVLIIVGCYLLASQFVPGRIMGMMAAAWVLRSETCGGESKL